MKQGRSLPGLDMDPTNTAHKAHVQGGFAVIFLQGCSERWLDFWIKIKKRKNYGCLTYQISTVVCILYICFRYLQQAQNIEVVESDFKIRPGIEDDLVLVPVSFVLYLP